MDKLGRRDTAFVAGLATMNSEDLCLLRDLLPGPTEVYGRALALGTEKGERALQVWVMVLGAAAAASGSTEEPAHA